MIHGNPGNDTIVSGLGNDEIFGDAGANILAYASIQQQGIDIVDRGTNGVTATLPNAGQTARAGGPAGPSRTSSIPTSARSSAATATTSWSATTSPTRSSVSLPRAPPA